MTAPAIRRAAPARHMPQLDALRALAVSAVAVHHFLPGGWGPGADVGVKLFFTLSGFLITGLLVRSRDGLDDGRQTWRGAIGRFYARRFLRIFPLYYFVIAVAFVIDLSPTRDIIGWLLTYTLNIHMARQGWYEASFAHFWSLAVEEQFYIVWPSIVLLMPRRALLPCAIVMTLVAPAYRLSYVLSHYENMTGLSSYISTWACLDSLGCGAVLALVDRRLDRRTLNRRLFRAVLPAAFVTCVALKLGAAGAATALILFPVAQAVVLTTVIRAAAQGLGGPARAVLEWPPLLYVGKISYGVYVYHPFAIDLSKTLATRTLGLPSADGWGVMLAAAVMTMAAASLSWLLLEGPINGLKRYFRDPE